MIIEVKVPSVGESVTSGVVSAWHKKSGEFVNEGEPLFALETDKVSTDIVAEKSGMLETKVPEGQEVKIGEVVAVIDDSKQTGNKTEDTARDKQAQKKQPAPDKAVAPGVAGVDRGDSSTATIPGQPQSTPAATDISPAVRRILDEERIKPEEIAATGPGG